MTILYHIADKFFFVFHIVLIVFNLFGWIYKPTRKWNLVTLLLTAFSWFILGIFYGFGYCFLTDWHWSIREKLDLSASSDSYIHFLVTTLLKIRVPGKTVDILTVVLFFLTLIISTFLNVRDYRKNRHK